MRFLKVFISFVLAALLAACGGGETSPAIPSYDKVVVSWGLGQIAIVEERPTLEVRLARNDTSFGELRACLRQDTVAEDGSIPFICASGGLWVWVQLDPVQGVLQDYFGTPPTASGVIADSEVAVTDAGVYSIFPDAFTLEFTPKGGTALNVGTSSLRAVGTFNWVQRYRYTRP